VVPDVRIEEEREGIFLVFEYLADVVVVLFVEVLDTDLVAGFVCEFAHVLVACINDVYPPLVRPLLDELYDVVEVLEVVDKDRSRRVEAVLLGDLFDEVKRQR
jgi:hypothetical protein